MKTFTITITLIVLAVGLQACRAKDIPLCQAEELLLTENSFPTEAHAGELHSPLPDNSRYSAGRTFYLPHGIANHDVYPYSSSRYAAKEFQRNRQSPIFSDPSQGWIIPKELSGFHSRADQYDIACGLEHQIPMCEMIAQYENYYVYFNIHTYPENGTLTDVRALLQEIDDKMAECLGK